MIYLYPVGILDRKAVKKDILERLDTHDYKYIYTVFQKKVHPYDVHDNYVKWKPI